MKARTDKEYWIRLREINALPDRPLAEMVLRYLGWKDLYFYSYEDGHRRRRGWWGVMPGSESGRCSAPSYLEREDRLRYAIRKLEWSPSKERRFHLNLCNVFALNDGFRDSAQVLLNAKPEEWCVAFVMTAEDFQVGYCQE